MPLSSPGPERCATVEASPQMMASQSLPPGHDCLWRPLTHLKPGVSALLQGWKTSHPANVLWGPCMALARVILDEWPLASGCSQVAEPRVGGALPSLCIVLPSSAQGAGGRRYAWSHSAPPSLGSCLVWRSVGIPFKLGLTSETPWRHAQPRSDVCPPGKAQTVKAPFVSLGKEGPH